MMTGKCVEMAFNRKVRGTFIVLNDRGLHTRPSTELVRCTTRFRSSISLVVGDMRVNGKSLLGVMTLAAMKGTKIQVEAEGPDAEEALEAIRDLASHQFYIQY